jgi:hypothetical protein
LTRPRAPGWISPKGASFVSLICVVSCVCPANILAKVFIGLQALPDSRLRRLPWSGCVAPAR